jgi:hypothetical protein
MCQNSCNEDGQKFYVDEKKDSPNYKSHICTEKCPIDQDLVAIFDAAHGKYTCSQECPDGFYKTKAKSRTGNNARRLRVLEGRNGD